MAIQVSDVILQVRDLIQDTGERATARYSDEALTRFVDQAVCRIATLRPDLFTYSTLHTLTEGEAEQALPEDAIRLVEIHYISRGSGVNERRDAMNEVQREVNNRRFKDWYAKKGRPVEFMRNSRNAARFFVYPAPDTTYSCFIEYAKLPDISSGTIDIIPRVFCSAIVDATCWAIEISQDRAVLSGRAQMFMDSYTQALGVSLQIRNVLDTESGNVDDIPDINIVNRVAGNKVEIGGN